MGMEKSRFRSGITLRICAQLCCQCQACTPQVTEPLSQPRIQHAEHLWSCSIPILALSHLCETSVSPSQPLPAAPLLWGARGAAQPSSRPVGGLFSILPTLPVMRSPIFLPFHTQK